MHEIVAINLEGWLRYLQVHVTCTARFFYYVSFELNCFQCCHARAHFVLPYGTDIYPPLHWSFVNVSIAENFHYCTFTNSISSNKICYKALLKLKPAYVINSMSYRLGPHLSL